MNNCNYNGSTSLLSIIPVQTGTASATSNPYYLSLLHYLCGNRKLCINSATPQTANLAFTIQSVDFVGTNMYVATILISGTLTYLPYQPNNVCPCLKTEGIICQIQVPCYSATGVPVVTVAGNGTTVTAANVQDCCTLAKAVEIESEITLTITPPTAP